MANKRFNQITRVVTSFDSNDVLPIGNGTLGDGKMPKDTLLELTAQNALAGNVAPEFDPTKPNDEDGYAYYENDIVAYDGKTYRFIFNHVSGPWVSSEVEEVDIESIIYKIGNEVLGQSKYAYYDISSASTGYYYDTNGALVSEADSSYIELTFGLSDEGKTLSVKVNDLVTTENIRYYILIDSNNNILEKVRNRDIAGLSGKRYTFTNKLKNGCKFKASWRTSDGSPFVSYTLADVASLENRFNSKIDDLENGNETTSQVELGAVSTGYYYNDSGSLVSDSSSSYVEITADSSLDKKQIIIQVGVNTGSSDTRAMLILDGEGNIKYTTRCGRVSLLENREIKVPVEIKEGYKIKLSWRTASGITTLKKIDSVTYSIEQKIQNTYLKYVSVDGDDSNEGSEIYPMRSITAAVKAGAETVILSGGVYDDNMIDLSSSIHDKIRIKGKSGEVVLFRKAICKLVDDGSETLVTGYSNVYEVSLASNPSYSGVTQWLFFDGLPDASTEIELTASLPLQRGKQYRCDCTKIVKTTADTLSEALDEIENSETFKWWYDTVNKKMYFNRSAATSVYPIYRPSSQNNGYYFTTRENQSVELSNIQFRYGVVNLTKLNDVKLYNVSSTCVYGYGCFVYDDTTAILFDHCEASLCFCGPNGDGFNGHANAGDNPSAKYCQATLRECWSHDNRDDGYSDHEYAEATIDGGLYEWNTKGGVTPSYGSQCVCKNVVSRNNYNGFYYTGTPTEGAYGNMICVNCLSENNNRGNSSNSGGYKVDGTGNRIKLVGCRSIGDMHGVVGGSSTSSVELMDFGCKSPVESVVTGSNVVVNNTSIYTA